MKRLLALIGVSLVLIGAVKAQAARPSQSEPLQQHADRKRPAQEVLPEAIAG